MTDTTMGGTGVAIGGLMRCCIESIKDYIHDHPLDPATDGTTLRCKYAPDDPDHRMVLRAGVWHWDRALEGER